MVFGQLESASILSRVGGVNCSWLNGCDFARYSPSDLCAASAPRAGRATGPRSCAGQQSGLNKR